MRKKLAFLALALAAALAASHTPGASASVCPPRFHAVQCDPIICCLNGTNCACP